MLNPLSRCITRETSDTLHEKREIPRNDLPHDSNRLMPRVAEVIPRNWNRLPVVLIGPTRIVPRGQGKYNAITGIAPQCRDRQTQIRRVRDVIRLAVVQGLETLQIPAGDWHPGRRATTARRTRSRSIRSAKRWRRTPRPAASIRRHGDPSRNAFRAA